MITAIVGGTLSVIAILIVVVVSVIGIYRIIPLPKRIRNTAVRHPAWITWSGVIFGLLYGLCVRYMASPGRQIFEKEFGVMSIAFLIGVPLAIGFLTVFLAYQEQDSNWKWMVTTPWIAVSLTLGAVFLLAWEGLICIALFLPLVLLFASIGGLIGGWCRSLRGTWSRLESCSALLLVMALPLCIHTLFEFPEPTELRKVENSIEIAAPADVVWRYIRSVDPIKRSEQRAALIHWIGFPRPISAQLTGEGIGAYRTARFERQVVFHEQITQWEPPWRLAFEIDPAAIPPTSLDPHVTVGGQYFDVLEGEYRIEQREPSRVLLRLSSTHRLSTQFNFYSRLWTDFLMYEIQSYILNIIKKRCEEDVPSALPQ